jgi:putative transcriptional regulator
MTMTKPTHVTNRITELRAAASMSQAELGDLIGVTRQTVNAIEGGKYSPSLEAAFKIARVLDVPLEDVFQYPASSPSVGPASDEDTKADRGPRRVALHDMALLPPSV